MEARPWLLSTVLTVITLLIQGLVADEHLMMERRLETINKPATKSFLTEHGDILDCVDINNQHAFDHPLLKNHRIQMKPTITIEPTKLSKSIANSSSESISSPFLPKSMRCPKGTVPIKRVHKEDLLMEKFMPFLARTLSSPSSNNLSAEKGIHEVAALAASSVNLGASGHINVWRPEVKAGQFNAALLYIATGSGSTTNSIQVGWSVNPDWPPTDVRLFASWTKDNGESTGCYNVLCPGFVQISRKTYLGATIRPVSEMWKRLQYYLHVKLRQDVNTQHWWLYCGDDPVGYWPSALFDTLTNASTRAGWGAEVYSPVSMSPPDMGSGYQGDLRRFSRSCHIKQLKILSSDDFPQPKDLLFITTDSSRYNVVYDTNPDYGHYIFLGGPKPM